MDTSWFEIENNFWCPCQDSSQVNKDHLPECRQHKIFMKISNSIEYLPEEIPQTQHGQKRNSVVDEFLANLETLNTSRRRSSSKLLPGFVPVDEIVPSLSTRVPGLEVYLPSCFSPTKLEKLESILDQDLFEIVQRNNICDLTSEASMLAKCPENNYENDDHNNYYSAIETKDELTSSEPSDFTAETVDCEKQSMEIRTGHCNDFGNDHYVANISNSASNMTISKLKNYSTGSNNVNMEIVQEIGNRPKNYDEMFTKDVSNMMTTKHEDKMQETAEKFSYCSLLETKSNKMSTPQNNLTEGLRRNTINESCSSCLEEESNKMSTTQRNVAERLRRNTMNEKFSNLQSSIPDIENKKISKVGVIKSAVAYIKRLEEEERFYLQMKAVEKQKNKQLLIKLAQYNTLWCTM